MTPSFDRRKPNRTQRHVSRNLQRQRGVIALFTMIAVVVMLIVSVALVRSVDSSLIVAGSIAFKRDILNQSERAIVVARKSLSSGGALANDVTRQSDSPANNYSASILATDTHGIPQLLLNNNRWASSGMAGADITDSTSGVTIRYVIDRLCTTSGPSSSAKCVVSSLGNDKGGSDFLAARKAGGESPPVYRISIRVTGPQNTQTYVQSTFSI